MTAQKVVPQEVLFDMKVLATMLGAGLPMSRSFGHLENHALSSDFRQLAKIVFDDKSPTTCTLAQMVKKVDGLNRPVIYEMLRAGEIGGCIDVNLQKLVELFEYERQVYEESQLEAISAVEEVIITSFWLKMFGELLKAGVPLLLTLGVLMGEITHPPLQEAAAAISTSLKEGGTVHEPMVQFDLLRGLPSFMCEIGEETGSLDVALLKMAELWKEYAEILKNKK